MPRSLVAAFALALPLAAAADTLTLRDGRVLQGVYRGGTAEMLHFELDGTLRGVPVGDVVSLGFLGRKPGDPAPTAQQVAPAPSVARVAAGTRLRVRLADTLDPHTNAVGDRFSGLLEMELQAAGTTIVASGSKVVGRITQAEAGAMTLELLSLQIGEASQAIVTGTQQTVTAAGAAPAAPAPASDRIPAGSLFEFRLLQPFDVRLR
jgi:hypothetical protein